MSLPLDETPADLAREVRSASRDAIKRAELREVRDELLARARTCEKAAEAFARWNTPSALRAQADQRQMASTFRWAADLADAKLAGRPGPFEPEADVAPCARCDS